jgi:hypothetical protein
MPWAFESSDFLFDKITADLPGSVFLKLHPRVDGQNVSLQGESGNDPNPRH